MVDTATVNSSGNWAIAVVDADVTAMGEGAEKITATQADAAGNTSLEAIEDITVDTVAPTITQDPTISADNTISLTVDEDSQAAIYDGANSIGTSVTLTAGNSGDIAVAAQTTKIDATTGLADIVVWDSAGNETTSTVTVALGTSAGDTLSGDADANLMFGFSDLDTITGGAGADTLSGGTARDKFVFGDDSGIDNVISDYDNSDADTISFGGPAGYAGNHNGKNANYKEADGIGTKNLGDFIDNAKAVFQANNNNKLVYYAEWNIGGSGDGYLAYDRDGDNVADVIIRLDGVDSAGDLDSGDIVV